MFKFASFKWAPLALCVTGASFVNADTWSSLDNAKGVSVQSVAKAPVISNANNGLSPAASQMLFSEIEMLKQEIQSLRSTVEEQGYELNKLKTEQKQRYLDLDRRMTQMLEVSSSSSKEVESVSSSGDGKDEYDAAFALMKQRKLDDASVKFKSFLKNSPKSELAVNGYYWLGQIYYNQGNLEEARKAFTIVANQYPDHQKTPDSTYKLGVVLHRLGDTSLSKKMLQSVVNQYADSASARFAAKYLKDNFK